MSDDLIPTRPAAVANGRYRLQGRIGVGGIAEVFLAHDTQLDAERAVKLMRSPRGPLGTHGMRFLAEARAMARIRHPNVLTVHELGQEEGWFWFVMDHATRGSIQQALARNGALEPLEALRVAFEISRALHAVHGLGLVHRDVKPENILLDDEGHALLADFGIARHPDGSMPMRTKPGQRMGTVGYRAPEQETDAHEVTEEADLYGVGASLFAMVTGKPPVLHLKQSSSMLPIPPAVRAVIHQATQAAVEERYPDARTLGQAICDAADDVARPDTPGTRWMETFDGPFDEPETPPVDATPPGAWRRALHRILGLLPSKD